MKEFGQEHRQLLILPTEVKTGFAGEAIFELRLKDWWGFTGQAGERIIERAWKVLRGGSSLFQHVSDQPSCLLWLGCKAPVTARHPAPPGDSDHRIPEQKGLWKSYSRQDSNLINTGQ